MFERFRRKHESSAWPLPKMPVVDAKRSANAPPPKLVPDLASALSRLTARWRLKNSEPLVPVDPDEVRAVFARLGSVATPDVLALYAALGAGGADGFGEPLLDIWPLHQVAEQERSDRGVLFADFLISSHEYRFCAIDASQSAVSVEHYDEKPMRVGLTLEAFLISLEADEDFVYRFG